jgi:hypothetical protein
VNDREKKERQQSQRLYEICHRLSLDNQAAFSDLSFTEHEEIIYQLISRVYIGRGDTYRIECSFGGTAQLQASEWHAKKAKNSVILQ